MISPTRTQTLLLLAGLLLTLPRPAGAQQPRDLAVMASASVQAEPPQIVLQWPFDGNARGYSIFRKGHDDFDWGEAVAMLPGTEVSYTDTDVAQYAAYEYKIEKLRTGASAYGYLYAGVEAPLTEDRGTVILVVDSLYAADLAFELERLQSDLIGDGWMVVRHDVERSDSVVDVRALIEADYGADPDHVRSVFLFGHVPVPYSGALAPDGHPDHLGAWPSDVYYGCLSGNWTDTTVDVTTASRPENRNVPGDGKFDQTSLAETGGRMDLQVGRVDLANLPAFQPRTEKDLLRQYLNKDHAFRHGQITAERRGLIDDNFGYFGGEAFAASGWRSFAPLFGASRVSAGKWFATLGTQSYLFAYGCGGGSYTSAGGVGSTNDFARVDTQTVFTMLFGSYFGDWDSTNNFLRAPLATTTYGLTSSWAGRPSWFYHHMALGATVGFSAQIAQNNSMDGAPYEPFNIGTSGIHVALMGDPTLRLHPVAPPSDLLAQANPDGGASLAWTDSGDPVRGYNVYRAEGLDGRFVRLNDDLIQDPAFDDLDAGPGSYVYQVRAVTLEMTPSGSYYNSSQGIFAKVTLGQ